MNVSIAIPDSCLQDQSQQEDKSKKISQIARAAAIFRTDTIYIYRDGAGGADRKLLSSVLRYLETPPFLRRRLFPKISGLRYAGALQPLKIPSHTVSSDPESIKAGTVREGVVFSSRGRRYLDVGIGRPLPYFGQAGQAGRMTVRFKSGHPEYVAKEIRREEADSYWGYTVKERGSLYSLLEQCRTRIVLTSRKSPIITARQIREYGEAPGLMVVFGSTQRGVHDILGGRIRQVQNCRAHNFFPDQATETVRVEEAVMGVLSILNTGGGRQPAAGTKN